MHFLSKYLRSDRWILLLFLILTSVVCVYIQQQYVIENEISKQIPIEKIRREAIVKIHKFSWLSYLLSVGFILLRIALASCCLYVGALMVDNIGRVRFGELLNIALKADIIKEISTLFYNGLVIFMDYDHSQAAMLKTSLLGFFDVKSLEPWMTIPLSMINVWELFYFIFLSTLVSVELKKKAKESYSFVFISYGCGWLLYLLTMIFIVMYLSQ